MSSTPRAAPKRGRWPARSPAGASRRTCSRRSPPNAPPIPVRLERSRLFGDVWLGWTLWRALQLDTLLERLLPLGREEVPWATRAQVLVLARLCKPSSELHIAEDWYRRTALDDLLALPAPLVNDDRCYRALDRLLPHKMALEQHLV